MPNPSQELTAKEILDKAFNNCQELHKCDQGFKVIQNMLSQLKLAEQNKIIDVSMFENYTQIFLQINQKILEKQNSSKAENTTLKNQYITMFKENLNTNYTTPDNTEVSVEDLFNCNISNVPYISPKKKSSDANNSSATNENKSVHADANASESTSINSSKSAMNSQKPAVPATKNPVSTLKPNVPQKPSTKRSDNKVTFGINNTPQPSVTKNPQVNKNTNTARNEQASSAAFNKNKELIKSVMGKMNRQADDFQSSSKFKPIVNSQKNMTQTMDDLLAEAGALNDNAILSEVEKIRNIISNMTVIVKRQKEKLEKIYETNDTKGLLSRRDDIIKNWDYLQTKYPSLLVPEDTDILNMEMPSDFVSGKSNWKAIKKRYIKLKYLKKDLVRVESSISNEIMDCRRETVKTVNQQLQDQLKTIIDNYSNRAKAMNNNSMFAIKVLTFIKKLNFTNLDFDKYFGEMASSVEDNHIKKYANNSKVTYNDEYLINFNQKYPKNIHDDSNIDKNTVSKVPSNLDSLSLSGKTVSFQKTKQKPTNNVAGNLKPGSASSGNLKNGSKPVAAGSTQKNKNKDASATEPSARQQKKNIAGNLKPGSASSGNPKNGSKPGAAGSTQKNKNKDASATEPSARHHKKNVAGNLKAGSASSGNPENGSTPVAAGSADHQNKKNKAVSAGRRANQDSSSKSAQPAGGGSEVKPHIYSPKNTNVNVSDADSRMSSVKSAGVLAKTSDNDNKALDLSGINYSYKKSSKTLDRLIDRVSRTLSSCSYHFLDDLYLIKYTKGMAESIMKKYNEKFAETFKDHPKIKEYIIVSEKVEHLEESYPDLKGIGWTDRCRGSFDLKSFYCVTDTDDPPENFKGGSSDWQALVADYKQLCRGRDSLSTDIGGIVGAVPYSSMWKNLSDAADSAISQKVISPLEKIKSNLNNQKISLSGQSEDTVDSIIKYTEYLIEKYSNFSRNYSKIHFSADKLEKNKWHSQKPIIDSKPKV